MNLAKVKIVLPSILAGIVSDEKVAEVVATTLGEALNKLAERYGDSFKKKICDFDGKPRRLLNLYVNGTNVRFLDRLDTKLQDGDEISILPTVSGG